MSEIQFRAAAIDDMPTILKLQEEFYAIDDYTFDAPQAHQALQTLINDATLGGTWLIYQQETLAGYVVLTFNYSLEFHGQNAIVDELYLLAPFRHLGIGTQTLSFLIEYCQQRKISALHLEVEQRNAAGQALYNKMGFQPHTHRTTMTKWLN